MHKKSFILLITPYNTNQFFVLLPICRKYILPPKDNKNFTALGQENL